MIQRSLTLKIFITTTLILFASIGLSWVIHVSLYEKQMMREVDERMQKALDSTAWRIKNHPPGAEPA